MLKRIRVKSEAKPNFNYACYYLVSTFGKRLS